MEPPARQLANAIEPIAAQAYFAPECHAAYAALGFDDSVRQKDGVHLPDNAAYFTARAAPMGRATPAVAAAAFGVFNPAVVTELLAIGWRLTTPEAIMTARVQGSVAQLTRILGRGLPRSAELAHLNTVLTEAAGAVPTAGRPLFGALSVQPVPDDPLGALWYHCDRLREGRGDGHVAAWVSAGLGAVQVGLLTELYWGMPLFSLIRRQAWSRQQLEDGLDSLQAAGLVAGQRLTDAGWALRESVEEATDRSMDRAVERLGDRLADVIELVTPWGAAIVDAAGYPRLPFRITGGGLA